MWRVFCRALQKELARLTEASDAGKLSERGKHDQFQGAYAESCAASTHSGRRNCPAQRLRHATSI